MDNNTVKKKCGFLAIGAGGGNVCEPFYKAAYPSLFINSARLDLDSLIDVDEKCKYHIPGGEGCNKDRKKSKEITAIRLDHRLCRWFG